MDRRKQTLKAGVVGLNQAEQRRVRGGKTIMPPRYALQYYRYQLANDRISARQNLLWTLNNIPR